MNEINALAKAKVDLTKWGYVPGSSFVYCDDCSRSPSPQGNWPFMAAAGSHRCIPHALEARHTSLLSLEGELIVELGRNPIEIAIQQHEVNMAKALKALVISAIVAAMCLAGLVVYLAS